MWDNGRKNINLDQAEFIDMGPLSGGDSRFNVGACTVLKGVKSLFEWWTETFNKRWPTEKALQIPDIPWLSVDEGAVKDQGNYNARVDNAV